MNINNCIECACCPSLSNVEEQMTAMQSQLKNILSVLGSVGQEGKQEIAKMF